MAKLWDKKVSPFEMVRKSGNVLAIKLVKKGVTDKMRSLPKHELADMI